jgi:ParB family chromosome partitioning protein
MEDIEIHKIRLSPSLLRPRTTDLDDLINSIRQRGLLQPIIVRLKDEHFEIVAGNRRYTACKSLGWRKIICHVVELSDKESFEISLIENVQRKTLTPLEEGKAYRKYVSDYGWGGVSELAERLGKSVAYITKRIKLLDLPSDIIDSISGSLICPSVAEELCTVKDKEKQSVLAAMIRKRHLSVKEAREMVKDNDDFRYHDDSSPLTLQHCDVDVGERAFDKSITIYKIALCRLAAVIESVENNWLIRDTLMHHNRILHGQIDLLIKCKRKYKRNSTPLVHGRIRHN